MVVAMIILGIASILASGILFRHKRILTLLAASGILFECWWLALTLLHRTLLLHSDAGRVFLIGALVSLIVFLPWRKQWRWPYHDYGSGWRDVVVLLVLVPVLASAWFIQQANGFIGTDWVAHGYYNGDTVTLAALVQRSLTTSGLVRENPFAANGPLEYPTLIHAGLAEIISGLGLSADWLSFLPLMVFIQILITIPLFFLLRDEVKEIPSWPSGYRWGWRGLILEGSLVVYVLAISWESYVYPQGHFFTTGLFVFLVALLVRNWSQAGLAQMPWSGLAVLTTIVLVLSNSVTGTAGAAVWTIFAVLRLFDRQRSVWERSMYGVSVVALFLFVVITTTPGAGHLSLTPWFSYSAATTLTLLSAPMILLLLAGLTQMRQQVFVSITAVALSCLSLVTFLFSDRELIIDNASRFLYHGLLVGWPLAVDSCVRNGRIVQARLRQLDGWLLRFSGISLLLVIVILLGVPLMASVAQVHDHLLFKDKNVSSVTTRMAMEWINEKTNPRAIILASPREPWEIPLFTGRSLLRAEYWISPDDDVHQLVVAAFAGDHEAQQRLVPLVDYVLLKGDEKGQWTLPNEKRIEHFGDIVLYDVRQ